MAACLQSAGALGPAWRGEARRRSAWRPPAAAHFQQPQGLERQQQQVSNPPLLNGNGPPAGLRAGAAPAAPAAAAPAAPPPAPDQHTGAVLQLHYRTQWEQPVLHHSVSGGEWRGVPMQRVVSGGSWHAADLQLDAAAVSGGAAGGAPLLEFVLTDGRDAWDKPADGGNYVIAAPGRWRLRDGQLAAVAGPPAVLVVSDLDDTMIGDDEATAAFARWWRDEAVPAGGRLVYNTGRALDLFEGLLAEKGGVMAEPDLLISAIGTRVYHKRGGRWAEDEAYTAGLGRGWSLEGVREACYRALAAVGKDAMHFRPPSEMSEHKVTCGVRVDVLEAVLASVGRELREARVAHRLVVSGSGGWRYMDLVPAEAGKLQALEYARRSLGFPPERTVACGDSGNDIDMLEGQHRSIIVGNAHPELLEWAASRRGANGSAAGELHVATGHRARGILEGLEKFGLK